MDGNETPRACVVDRIEDHQIFVNVYFGYANGHVVFRDGRNTEGGERFILSFNFALSFIHD